MKLTKDTVRALRKKEREYFVWDDDVRGFGVRVHPTGRSVFVLKYRSLGDRRTKRLVLGGISDVTVRTARGRALAHRGDISKGTDPRTEKRSKKSQLTVAELGVDYLEHTKDNLKPSTAKGYEWMWKLHVLPNIGSKRVAEVTLSDVTQIRRKLKATPYQANRVVALIGAFLSYAIQQGQGAKADNPATEVEPYPEKQRDRFLSPEEFTRLGAALLKAETEGLRPVVKMRRVPKSKKTEKHRTKTWDKPIKADPFAVACIRLLAMTGLRRGEALSLRWDAVDLARGYITLAESKTGKSVRAIGAEARNLLASQPRLEGSPWVFPGRNGSHITNVKRLWESVRFEAKLENLRIHDLRHSAASTLAMGGESLFIIGHVLGHKDSSTTARYAHLSNDPLRAAADRVASDVAAWMSGAQTPVTPLPRAKSAGGA